MRPLEAQHVPPSLSHSGNDRAELLGVASGTAEVDRVKKATQAIKVLSKVQSDWQIVVEKWDPEHPPLPFQTENKNSAAMSDQEVMTSELW